MEPVEYTGYYPGLIGDIISLHGSYYAEHHNLDLSFESIEARELGEFGQAFDPKRDFWQAARCGGVFAGSIAIDGRIKDHNGARLRWFIVNPAVHCQGVGTNLLANAIQFCRQAGHQRVHLYTFKGLDAAKRLYLKHGFDLAKEYTVEQWGITLDEQLYILDL